MARTTPDGRFFAEARAAFRRGSRRAGGVEEHGFAVAGLSVRLRFAGPALVSAVVPAFSHLAPAEPAGAPLEVCLFDRASTGEDLPPPRWGADAYLPRGGIRCDREDRYRAAYLSGLDLFSMIDLEAGRALYWAPDADCASVHERSLPLRILLNWWLGHHGRQMAHAAAVGIDRAGILMPGAGGSGKSTTALACLRSELRLAGDDHVVLTDSPPSIHSLYCSAKVDAGRARSFPWLSPHRLQGPGGEPDKEFFLLSDGFSDALARSFPAGAILIPQIGGGRVTRIEPASRAEALAALAPSTLHQLPGDDLAAFRRLGRFVRRIPCYRARLSADMEEIPAALTAFLRGLS